GAHSRVRLRSAGGVRPRGRRGGCELGVNSRSCMVKEDDDFLEHLVLLRTISLGADARDELHVVAVESKNTYGDHKPVPIASLRVSVLPMVSKGDDLTWFVPPVTFMLQCGTGPVYLSGQHVTCEFWLGYGELLLCTNHKPLTGLGCKTVWSLCGCSCALCLAVPSPFLWPYHGSNTERALA
uniref:Nucleoplasmin ATPase-like n=1 Tax=Coturnix japonica TaxID=93934 RepID=A0A8C2TUQ4_COTJA